MRRREFLVAGAAAMPLMSRNGRALAAPGALPLMPPGFVFGASTSAYQIEGAVAEDGRAPSIWDTFSHQPGRIATGETGDVACDHYHRYAGDVDLLADAGFGGYRFSVSWPRVQPQGSGATNPAGLGFYDRLVDRLAARNVVPYLCLYHWDLPQALQDRGGWLARDTAARFADYARLVVRHLGDRVRHVAMLNEPSIHAIFGHALGSHAPGGRGWQGYLGAQHHQNLAQGLGLQAVRAERGGLKAGTVLALQPVVPATPSDADRAAALRFDAVLNRANLDPLFHGRYPEGLAAEFAPLVAAGDLAAIHQKVDFLGINYYSRAHAVDAPWSPLSGATYGPAPPGTAYTEMGWPIEPAGLTEMLVDLRDRYGNPTTLVTETGAAFADLPGNDGTVDDAARTAFIRAHLLAARRAVDLGCRLGGFFVWSLLDNFEWAEGTRRRFGLVRVDFATQRRTPKASYAWLKQVIAANRGVRTNAAKG